MLARFNVEIAACVRGLTDEEAQDFCWKGGCYFLYGDWANPTVGVIVGAKVDPGPWAHAERFVSVCVEPLLYTEGSYGQRVSKVQIFDAQDMLLREADEIGLALTLFRQWQLRIAALGPGTEVTKTAHEVELEAEMLTSIRYLGVNTRH